MQIIKPYEVSRDNLLSEFYNWSPSTKTANSTPMIIPKTQTLPNGGGTYNPAGASTITPAPVFTGVKKTPQIAVVKPASTTPAPTAPSSLYDKYRDPKTGKIMTPEEYAIYLGNKIPKGNGEITNYAGDALTNPNQSSAELEARARTLANSRNDLATGTTDPYKVGNQSGIAYSPTELKAIENAYAGVYDPALGDVFARLKATQAAEKEKADLQAAKELEVFKTNEAIRQWRETTGIKASSGGGSSSGKGTPEETTTPKTKFTSTQINSGASKAGLGIEIFKQLDDDIKNFYINTPTGVDDEGKKVPIYQIFNSDFQKVTAGDLTPEQLSEDITGSSLPEAVKHYFIDQIPAAPAQKEGWIQRIWGAITGK